MFVFICLFDTGFRGTTVEMHQKLHKALFKAKTPVSHFSSFTC